MSTSFQRSQVANAAKSYKSNPSEQAKRRLDDARRDLAEQKIAEYVRRTVDAAPLLTPEQRDRLALLLQSASGGAA